MKALLKCGGGYGFWDKLCACAFWVGLLYDEATLNKTYDYIKQFSYTDISNARDDVPINGFDTKMGDKTLHQIGLDIIELPKLV